MAKCTLDIAIDTSKAHHPGDTLAGLLSVDVDTACTCRALTVELFWRTRGFGNTNTGGNQVVTVHRGPWEAGEAHAYPFEFTIPDGPPSMEGQLVSIEWVVNANADLPWAFDPNTEAEVFVLPRSSTSDVQHVAEPESAVLDRAAGIIGAVLLVVSVPLFLFSMCFGSLVFALSVVFIWYAVSRYLAKQLLGDVELHIPHRASAGEDVPVDVSFTPTRDVDLSRVELTFTGLESATRGSGSNKTTRTHEIVKERVAIAGQTHCPAGKEVHLHHLFQVPDDAPPSLDLRSNRIRWSVEVHIDIPRWPDFKDRRPLLVN